MAEAIPVLRLDTVDSTNLEARRRAEAGETGPLWITADHQTAGRGRRGRAWDGGAANLAATLLFRTDRAPAEAAQATFVAALAVAEVLDAWVPPSLVTIKWPNDVLIDGAKASGMLIESGPHPTGGLWLAVGVGINLAEAPTGLERPAAAIAHHLAHGVAAPPTRDQALAALSAAFAAWSGRWDALGFVPILDAWSVRAGGPTGPCVARLGTETVPGVAEGVAPDGALRLRLADGSLRLISAGDVFFGGSA